MGVYAAAARSAWRGRHLPILCYHGVSFADEHLWSPGLYLSRDAFRERMRMLHDGGYNVLPLEEALRRLEEGTLPPRSVALTFDDGSYSFYALAFPILREFDFPATVYLPTYYCLNQMPVFDVTASYLLWKGRGKRLELDSVFPGESGVQLSDANALPLFQRIHRRVVTETPLSAEQKDELAAQLARQLGLNYQDLARRRIFHLMTPGEVSEVCRHRISIELHTHRHRTPRDRSLFLREIHDNRAAILEITGAEPAHMCYPRGDFTPEYFPWLREEGVRSAATCELGFAAAGQEPLRLPRLLDTSSWSAVEFEGWLTGVCAALPHRGAS